MNLNEFRSPIRSLLYVLVIFTAAISYRFGIYSSGVKSIHSITRKDVYKLVLKESLNQEKPNPEIR